MTAPLPSRFCFPPVLAVVLFALTLAGCGNSYEWNQKVTVLVETPSGERAGSSIMHVEWNGGIPFFEGDMRGGGYKLAGEAPLVDLGNSRYLFALLRGMDGLAHVAITGGRDPMSQAGTKIEQTEDPLELAPKLYPMLVTFTNVNDPATLRRADPADLSATFGPGYALKAITLEITKEPVTVGRVESVLAWINRLSEFRRVADNPFTSTLPQEIGYLRRAR